MPELEVQMVILSIALKEMNDKAMGSSNIDNVMESSDGDTSPGMVGDGGIGTFSNRGYPLDDSLAEFLSIERYG